MSESRRGVKETDVSSTRRDVARFPITVRNSSGRVDRTAVRSVLGICLEAESVQGDASIGLLFCGDRTMKELNAQFRGKDKTTDVLSFPEDPDPSSPVVAESGPFLGDIAISLPQCFRQAGDQSVDPGEELVRLLVHGVLHLLGYDHIEMEERKQMEARERVCRRRARSRGLGPGMLVTSSRPGAREARR